MQHAHIKLISNITFWIVNLKILTEYFHSIRNTKLVRDDLGHNSYKLMMKQGEGKKARKMVEARE